MSERAEADIIEFGLTALQARVYLTLLKLGKARAGRLSFVAGIVRPEVYRILRELSSQGLIQRTPGTPSTYAAISPDKGLSLVIDRQKRRLAELEHKKVSLVKVLESRAHNDGIVDRGFNVIMGVDNVIIRARQLISETKQEYAAIMSKYALRRADEDGVMRVITSSRKRNVQVRIISEIDESNSTMADMLSKHVELRRSNEVFFYVDIFDRREMLFGPAISDDDLRSTTRREIDLWTNNAQFIKGMQALFERLWAISPRYKRRDST
jgi:sugar-specific transcriptional regulator TrmB